MSNERQHKECEKRYKGCTKEYKQCGKKNVECERQYCETKVWLILILMITKQGLELMIIFQV